MATKDRSEHSIGWLIQDRWSLLWVILSASTQKASSKTRDSGSAARLYDRGDFPYDLGKFWEQYTFVSSGNEVALQAEQRCRDSHNDQASVKKCLRSQPKIANQSEAECYQGQPCTYERELRSALR
jgi:hypothetical protein